jgi:hypothetical protein
MSGHTPDRLMMHYEWDATGYPVFYVHGLSGEDKRDRNKLDALLVQFEAAPDLLAACKLALENGDLFNADCSVLEAAIAKAEGR